MFTLFVYFVYICSKYEVNGTIKLGNVYVEEMQMQDIGKTCVYVFYEKSFVSLKIQRKSIHESHELRMAILITVIDPTLNSQISFF